MTDTIPLIALLWLKFDMHKKAIESIEKHIENALDGCLVENNWPVFDSYTDAVFKFSTEVLKHKKEWLTVSNCYSIFADHVGNLLFAEFPRGEETATGKLVELLDSQKITSLKQQIVEYIASIPRSYQIYFPLPKFKEDLLQSIDLSESLFIKKFSDPDEVPGGASGVLETLAGSVKLLADSTYIVTKVQGYARGSLNDMVVRQSISNFKQFLHMCSVFKVTKKLEPAVTLGNFLGKSAYINTIDAVIFDLAKPDEVSSYAKLPIHLSSHINKIALNTDSEKYKILSERGSEGISQFFISRLKKTADLINSNTEDAQFIRSAIEWAFDASLEENETLSFIQASIGLEAILGEETGRDSLTETLSDRCAYLLASNIGDRKKIRDNFREFYKLRSKLIHGRSMQLKEDEKGFLDWGKSVLNGVIVKEINNLKSSQP